MFSKKNAVVRTKKYAKLIRLSVIIALIIGISGLFAYGWQNYEETKYPEGTEKDYSLPDAFLEFAQLINDFMTQNVEEENPSESSEKASSEDGEDVIIVVGNSGDETEENPSSEETSSEEEPEIRGGIVPEGKNEGYYSFGDSLFVGDYFVSQADSLGYFEYSQFAYVTGLDMNTVLTKKVMKTETGSVTLANYIKTLEEVEAIYVMFSAESISWMDYPTFVKKYVTFVDEIVKAFPKAHIYLQPILPINEEKAVKRGYSVTNDKINQINAYIYSYAEENSFWILDMTSKFKDENGILPLESTTNGIRLERPIYEIWADYIVTHKAHR